MKKIILLTWATDGIWKLLAYKLAGEWHTLYLHGRNEKKLQDIVADIHSETHNTEIFSCVADFSDLDSVKNMTQKLLQELSHVDIVINNAWIFKTQHEQTAQWYDIRFVVNYLAPYLLTHDILPLLKNSESPRVINLSSAAQAPVSLDALLWKVQLWASEAYAQSKLALTMWSFDFAKNNPDIITIAVNPGSLLNTKMANEAYGQHWSSADKGRDILYDLALWEKYQNDSWKYYDNDSGMFTEAHSDAYDQDKIWNLIITTEQLMDVWNF